MVQCFVPNTLCMILGTRATCIYIYIQVYIKNICIYIYTCFFLSLSLYRPHGGGGGGVSVVLGCFAQTFERTTDKRETGVPQTGPGWVHGRGGGRGEYIYIYILSYLVQRVDLAGN